VAIEIVGTIREVETIAVGRRIREFERLKKVYGPGRWRKRKGIADVRLPGWYEAHGIGRREFKIKRLMGN